MKQSCSHCHYIPPILALKLPVFVQLKQFHCPHDTVATDDAPHPGCLSCKFLHLKTPFKFLSLHTRLDFYIFKRHILYTPLNWGNQHCLTFRF